MLESDSSLITKIIRATTEDPLELLKLQQSAIQKQLLNQELMNKHLYESLFNAGFLTTTKYTTIGQPSASTNFLDSIKQKFNLNSPLSTSTDNSIVSKANNMNPLAAMMPLGDLFKGMNSILSSLFGSEYWMYWLIALAMGIACTFISCCCIYCICCSSLGRSLFCIRCGGFSTTNSKKKKESGPTKCCI